MAHPPKTILMCSCEDTMRLDPAAVQRGCRNSEIATFRQLCRAELDQFRKAAKAGGSLAVGRTPKVPRLTEEAGEPPERVDFLNISGTPCSAHQRNAARPQVGGPPAPPA